MLAAALLLGGLAALFALVLGASEYYLASDKNSLSEQINRLLPQTQCAQCGHPGCRPYAEAIASGGADINQCPPGGDTTIASLAKLLGREAKALDSSFGVTKELSVAVIDEDNCIGCTLCIQACPVDAILGAAQKMHSVISAECTGCELCIPPCPVDCIDMQAVETHNTPELIIRTNPA